MFIRSYIPILILLLALTIKGQQLHFNYIGDKLGLPAHECYNVIQDSKGYIWISTEAGLCKYNGTKSKVYNKKNGFTENACYAIREDNKGKLWILTSGNRVLTYLNDTLHETPFSKNYSKQFNGVLNQSYNLCFKNDSVVISTHNSSFITAKNSSSIRPILTDTNCAYYFIKTKTDLISVKSITNRRLADEVANKGIITIGINTGKEIRRIHFPFKNKGNPSWRVLTVTNKKQESFVAMSTLLIKLNSDLSYSTYNLPGEALCLYTDKDDGLWVGTLKGGLYYYTNTGTMASKIENLKGFSVTGVCVDEEKGVWCTTLEKSVFYCQNKYVVDYGNNFGLEKQTDFLKDENGKVFTSVGNNELIELNQEGIRKNKINLIGNYEIDDIVKDKNGWLIGGKNFILKTDLQFLRINYIKTKDNNLYAGASQFSIVRSNRIFAVHYGRVIEVEKNTAIDRKNPLESAGICIEDIGNNNLLFGCKDGLYRMRVDTLKNEDQYFVEKLNSIIGSVVKIVQNSKNETWIATKENGLYILKDNNVTNISDVLKLPTERYCDITEDKFGNMWVGSYVGLIKIKDKKYTIYNRLNGLLSDEIIRIAADNNYIYASTTEGINRLDLKGDLSNSFAPKVYINSVKINETSIDHKNSLLLDYHQNSLKIELDALTFKEINTPNLFYSLKTLGEGTNKEALITGSLIVLDNLPADSYELSIYAVNNDGIKSVKPAVLRFEIQKPFWQTIRFISIFAISVGILTYFLVKQIIKGIREKEEEKTKINKQLAEYQLTALQAQMNPHFIFNAINSVQRYILEKSKQEAYDYLAKFGKLIRMVLNNSEEKILTLQQELEMLKLYVELEQMRFNNSFEFRITIAADVNPFEIQLPAMLIQPYIENAIWHGLMNLNNERKGILKVEISVKDELLKIVIEDNGIGRKRAEEYKETSIHSPKAMKLTEQRIMMINQMKNYESAKVVVSDLTEGTRVEIILPV